MKPSFRPLPALFAVPTAALLLVSSLAACASGGAATHETSQPSAAVSSPAPSASASDSAELSYPGEDGRTALELLLEADPSAVVNGEGEMAFVTTIRGRAAKTDSEFWALYVDGEAAQVGAGVLETKSDQTVTWKLEEFE